MHAHTRIAELPKIKRRLMLNNTCFGDLGHIPFLPKTIGWRITPPALVGRGAGGGAPSTQKSYIFFTKITEF